MFDVMMCWTPVPGTGRLQIGDCGQRRRLPSSCVKPWESGVTSSCIPFPSDALAIVSFTIWDMLYLKKKEAVSPYATLSVCHDWSWDSPGIIYCTGIVHMLRCQCASVPRLELRQPWHNILYWYSPYVTLSVCHDWSWDSPGIIYCTDIVYIYVTLSVCHDWSWDSPGIIYWYSSYVTVSVSHDWSWDSPGIIYCTDIVYIYGIIYCYFVSVPRLELRQPWHNILYWYSPYVTLSVCHGWSWDSPGIIYCTDIVYIYIYMLLCQCATIGAETALA